ncbi:MAG: hypothetical protein IPH59_09610 [bacterium]|nr:hypothetical protein [bacterium]
MRNYLICALLALFSTTLTATNRLVDIDRTGSVFFAPKLGISYPMGALADANYKLIASSWRKEGITLTGEFGYYITKSTVAGMELSYSNFHPKSVSIFPDGVDESRVRFRRGGIFMQYYMVSTGKYRPFVKLGLGLFEANRISLPQIVEDEVVYKDYSLGAKPVYSFGLGVHGSVTPNISLTVSIEAVSLNSFSSAWETSGATLGPLRKNMLFFPVYFGMMYHLSDE